MPSITPEKTYPPRRKETNHATANAIRSASPLMALLERWRHHDPHEDVRRIYARHRTKRRDIARDKDGVEDVRESERYREPPDKDRDHVLELLSFVEIYRPDKQQIHHGLQDSDPDKRSAQTPAHDPSEDSSSRMGAIILLAQEGLGVLRILLTGSSVSEKAHNRKFSFRKFL